MGHAELIEVAVTVAREAIDSPWQPFRWRPVEVTIGSSGLADWTEVGRDERSVRYHAATVPLELHRKETDSYLANLNSGDPAVYVVLRFDPEAERTVSVLLATASPYEAQAYGDSGQETIEQVAMPAQLIARLEQFVAEHHEEKKFVKRQREKHHREEDHLFGKEPIFAADRFGTERKR